MNRFEFNIIKNFEIQQIQQLKEFLPFEQDDHN